MTCDICDNREAEFYGRWIAWCSKCKDQGKSKDRQMVIDNELSPDIESGDFSYTLEQGLGDYLIWI